MSSSSPPSSSSNFISTEESVDSNVAIRVSNLSKVYHMYERPKDRLKQSIFPRLQSLVGRESRNYYREFWALKHISFDLRKGETVGIIGRNGAGKSTLLQIICGTLQPSSGKVESNGRVAALLELGSGFNPEFTGRDNVFMNAAILGLSKEEIDSRFDDIASFADIGDFMEQPVKTYSSGMLVRLAFAVQAQVEPDILIVDEALAVGDAKYQAKCFERLKQLRARGTSILLVTHSSEQIVTHCNRAILIENGSVIQSGHPKKVVNTYLDLLFGKAPDEGETLKPERRVEAASTLDDINAPRTQLNYIEDNFATRSGYNEHEYRWGNKEAAILDFYMAAGSVPYPSFISTGERVSLEFSIRFYRDIVRPILGIMIKTKEGMTVYSVNSETLHNKSFHSLGKKGEVIVVSASFVCRLVSGDYFISVGVASKQGEDVIPHDRRYDSIHIPVRSSSSLVGVVDLDLELSVKEIFA